MSLKKLAGETAIYGVSSILGRVLSFYLVRYYTDLFTPEEYGIVTILFAGIAFAMIFYTFRFELAYFRFATDKSYDKQKVFNVSLSSIVLYTIFATIIFYFLAPVFAEFQEFPDKVDLVYMSLAIVGFDVLCEIPKAKLRLDGRPIRFATIMLINVILTFGLIFFFLYGCPYILNFDDGFIGKKLVQNYYDSSFGIGYIFLANIIASSTVFLLLLPEWKQFKLLIDKALWTKMLNFSLPMVLVGISYIINELFDRIGMIKLLEGTEEFKKAQIGIYGANYKLAMILALFTQAFKYGAEPFFFIQKEKKEAYQTYADVAKYFFIIGIFGFLFISLYLDFFKQFFLTNPEYWAGQSVVPILLIANLFAGMYYNFSVWYKITDKTEYGAYIAVTGAIITILLNLWWVPIFGYLGAAWATLICYGLMMFLAYFFGRKYLPMPYQIGKMLAYLFLGIGVYFLSVWLNQTLATNQLTYFFLNSFLLVGFMGLLWIFERNDLKKALK